MGRLDPSSAACSEKAYVVGPNGEARALSVGTNSAGGYTVPPGFRDELIETMKWYGNVRQEATNINTDSGQPLQWPTFNGTVQVGRIIAENVQLTQTDPAFGTATLGAYMYSSDLVLVPYQFLQDSAIDASSFLARILGTRIGRIQNQHFTTGTGSSQPLGIQTNADHGRHARHRQHHVGDLRRPGEPGSQPRPGVPAGRQREVHGERRGAGPVPLLVDSQNRPLWQPAVVAGEPDVILGYPIVVNNDMPAPAANAKSILFGDFPAGSSSVTSSTCRSAGSTSGTPTSCRSAGSGSPAPTPPSRTRSAYKALVQSAT
jgi:predicted phage gp36 major capsid-like protein